MHVQANMAVKPSVNVVTSDVIPWFTNFTLLFMVISAFSMCCGYYERVKNGMVTPAKFYAKRYHRTWPFFAMKVVISFVVELSWSTFGQSFADLTMCFNLLPNPHIEVVGVGWFLGTVFTFYMLFPFFIFLLDNKKRGWMVLLLSLLFCHIAIGQFDNGGGFNRVNIINSAPYFISGGMIYLYRHSIKRWVETRRVVALVSCAILTMLRFIADVKVVPVLPDLFVFTAWLMYAIGSKDVILNNRVAKYLSGVSMEIYLCHMMFYRVVSMMHLDRFIEQCDVLYVVTFIVTFGGAVCFSHVVKYYVFPLVEEKSSRILWKS